MSKKHLIIAPPMTPNGDLHVGHMSGPYLAADVYKRYLAQYGHTATYVISSDDNQSYVDTSARRLGLTPQGLIDKSRTEISETLSAYQISIDRFGQQDAEYAKYVNQYFKRLYDGGLLEIRQTEVLFDTKAGAYTAEAFVSGFCPTCLDSTCGGICEACGHPNACTDLLGLDTTRYQRRIEPRLVLDLERFRPELDEYLGSFTTHRPALKRLIDELLSEKLAPFVASYKMERGIGAGFLGLPDQRLNVWGEMYCGHLYFLEQAAGKLSAGDEYLQFFGFDNSYFYVIVHAALAIASRRCGLDLPTPSAFITNQFYFLDAAKFSTSKNHLVWGRELTREYSSDVARLFLALHGPEYQEASFSRRAFGEHAGGLGAKVNGLVARYNAALGASNLGEQIVPEELRAVFEQPLLRERFSMGMIARRALNAIGYLDQELARGQNRSLSYVPAVLRATLAPLCPAYSDAIGQRCGLGGPSWHELRRSNLTEALPEFPVQR